MKNIIISKEFREKMILELGLSLDSKFLRERQNIMSELDNSIDSAIKNNINKVDSLSRYDSEKAVSKLSNQINFLEQKVDIAESIEERILKETTELISVRTISEEKVLGHISGLIKGLKSGDIRIKNRFGGANGPEIISKINRTLETTDWQINFSYFNIEENVDVTIPSNQQMTVHGDLIIEGNLLSEGNLILEL